MPIQGILEIVDSGWYDSVGFPRPNPDAEAPSVHLFGISVGYMDRHPVSGRMEPKTEIETNMLDANQLLRKFVLRSIRVALIDLAGDLMSVGAHSRFYRSILLRFWIHGKTYCLLPIWKLADPAVLFADPRTFVDIFKEMAITDRQDFIRSLRKRFDPEVVIETAQPFGCELRFDQTVKWDSPTAPAGVTVLLEGQDFRAVQ